MNDVVLLTDGRLEDKMIAHIKGHQHYAFSIFIFNCEGKLLLQKRSYEKYHSGGLWSNTCCSHPTSVASIDGIKIQAIKRLELEMGILCSSLNFSFKFAYNKFCNGLIENEIDYVFYGFLDDAIPIVNKEEVCDYRWVSLSDLKADIIKFPELYTVWFCDIINLHMHDFKQLAG